MAGTLLGADQVRKLNSMFPVLVAHIASLLSIDHTGFGLMRVHSMVESFDSDEMARIFRELSFISPKEKLALVRAAVYELMVSHPELFISPQILVVTDKIADTVLVKPDEEKVFTPPQFKLNVNSTDKFHGERPADTPPPAPIVTSTHTSKVSEQLKAGDEEKAKQQAKIDVAVAKLHEASKPIELMAAPEDATLPQE